MSQFLVIPPLLEDRFNFYWNEFSTLSSADIFTQIKKLLASKNYRPQLQKLWVGSEYAADLCLKHPEWILELLDKDLDLNKSYELFQQELAGLIGSSSTEDELLHALRIFRNKNMLRIIWRDFNRIASTMQTTKELSYLADTCIQQANDFCHRKLCVRYGTPRDEHGNAQYMLVIGMGKLGAHELNLSSDIDLIFSYPEEGVTDHRVESTSNHQFFIKLGQKLINALGKITVDGFVFRVDMALRPHGGSGPLVCSFASMENYYQEQGRTWERYAMIKARVITGMPKDVKDLTDILRPFTYRRYIDFSVVQSLREMKALINREVKRRGYKNDVKLGPGGIREIEFMVQAIQLIRGGRDPEFQKKEITRMFNTLQENNLFSAEQKQKIEAAYLFLRDTEHVLQGYKDEQTQKLPSNENDDTTYQRIAWLMGFSNYSEYENILEQHREFVSALFKEFASFDDKDDQSENAFHRRQSPEWFISLWESTSLEEKHALLLKNCADYKKISGIADILQNFQEEKSIGQIQGGGKDRLNSFLPKLLDEAINHSINPTQALQRIFPLVLTVLRRSAYLVLLNENPQAIKQLVLLTGASPWIADQLATHPVLLDELLDERSLFYTPDKQEISDALRQEVLRIPLSDLEAQMEALRYFKLARCLHIAACEVTGRLPLMKVSDYLTWLAEAILNHALTVAWHDLTARYGKPLKKDGSVCDPSFIVVGYGKLGGLELNHHSDLDVVFIHGADPLGSTTGVSNAKPPQNSIDNATFYARLGQRLIHIMETRTHGGQLYEIDTQLRPSGNSGMLVISIDAFKKYQQEKAWTWEHQALVRARVVAGSGELAQEFEQIRKEVLTQARDKEKLKQEIVDMRKRMFRHLSSKQEAAFDLKQDKGGVVDIEFLVQYAVLAWAHQQPSLIKWPDNIRILEELSKAKLLQPEDAEKLIEIYKTLRSLGHQKALQNEKIIIESENLVAERKFVTDLWIKIMKPDIC